MRPWTTRTLNAAVVAAGFAALGTGSASAETLPAPLPDLTPLPDDLGVTVPLETCRERPNAPCADAGLKASVPNVVKQVGADIVTTSRDTIGQLRHEQLPVASVLAEVERLERTAKTRPTVDVELEPHRTGLLDKRTPQAGLLDAKIGPRAPDHQGVSAADTAIELTAARGYGIGPVTEPVGAVVRMADSTVDEVRQALPNR